MAPHIRTPLLPPFLDLPTCTEGIKVLLWGDQWDILLLDPLWDILGGRHIPTIWGRLDRLIPAPRQDHRIKERPLLPEGAEEGEGRRGTDMVHRPLMVQGISPLQGICHLPLHTWEAMPPHPDHLLTILLLVADTQITFQNGNETGNLLTETRIIY